MFTILGAGGSIGKELAKEIVKTEKPVRLVARHPKVIPGSTEIVPADISNLEQVIEAVSGSTVVFLVAGLKYDTKVWQEMWPRIMGNTIEACKRSKSKLIFFDNVYMYGRVLGPMTEETAFRPISKKGEIRAQIATTLLNEIQAGNITALIARSADFYGPYVKNSPLNMLVFDKLAKGGTASWLVNDSVRHSFTFTPDAAKSLILLAQSDASWNQTWHVPTVAKPQNGKQYIQMIAKEFEVPPKYRVLNKTMVRIVGLLNSEVRETYEMLYQYEWDYVFDSSKFATNFQFDPTPYTKGIRSTAYSYKNMPA